MKSTFSSFLVASILFSCIEKNSDSVNLDTNYQILESERINDSSEILRKKTLPLKDKLSQAPSSNTEIKMTMISSGQISPSSEIELNGISFDLVLKDEDTVYLSTTSQAFKTPEGFKVGTRLSDLPLNIQHDLIKEPGWGYYHSLKSGWALAFCEGTSCTEKYPGPDSKVEWIFKRP